MFHPFGSSRYPCSYEVECLWFKQSSNLFSPFSMIMCYVFLSLQLFGGIVNSQNPKLQDTELYSNEYPFLVFSTMGLMFMICYSTLGDGERTLHKITKNIQICNFSLYYYYSNLPIVSVFEWKEVLYIKYLQMDSFFCPITSLQFEA